MSLASLPVELLFEIQLSALSSALPYVNKFCYDAFSHAPVSLRIEYLARRHEQPHTISKALLYPLCTPEILQQLLNRPDNPATVPPSLPRRFFRNLQDNSPPDGWKDDSFPLPLLRVLFNSGRTPNPDPNAHKALQYAVAARFDQLVEFLLARGADPKRSGARAITIAIEQKNLQRVRLLCERRDQPKRGKKRKLEDRVDVDTEFLRLAVKRRAVDIAEYFVDKGVVPDMDTLRLLGGRSSIR
ncbi:hypothetical protein BKA62DRAFT_740204 [Auriculariales sp. MPI-PUGE-AT-0066]|nr:hypothetical protein BKA62DRAFT_740204 [Auriculariales sp. MPI-PUGE-AT-0066]